MPERKTWIGDVPEKDDFGRPITNEFIDGATKHRGMWAFMTPESFELHGAGRLGTGFGQRYRLDGGEWVKVEG